MKIAFDPQIFTQQEYGGISRYVCSLATQLATLQGVDVKVFAPLYINAYLAKMPRNLVSGVRVPIIPVVRKLYHLSSQLLSCAPIAKFAPRVLHETYYSHIPIIPKDVRRVVTVHDMIHENFSSCFSKGDRTSKLKIKSILGADHVICVSENTRRDLLSLMNIKPEKISVVHHGFDRFIRTVDQSEKTEFVTTKMPYLLYVGKREKYKNFEGLLQAYASSSWLKKNVRIVCFGGGALRTQELTLMQQLGLTDKQVEQATGNDKRLAQYYQNAAAFVYPSLYEGFGIPPLEAMSLQCPVICSNASSIPEVVGDAGEYFVPGEIGSMRDAMERVVQSMEMREHLIKKGGERCKRFTWERCASDTLAIYRRISG